MNVALPAAAVCAIVVTYNRKEMLARCLDALLRQTVEISTIVVVDNASTDGTAEMLRSEPYATSRAIEYLQLPDNGGGAAGFHHGFRSALATAAEWLWAMDDDGLPAPDALEQLLAAPASAGPFRGPVVLAREITAKPEAAADELAFPGSVETRSGRVDLRTIADLRQAAEAGVVQGYACAFNGVLIRRDAVERIGLPNKDFFIWGDEWDYLFRAREQGILVSTVLAATYWHPPDRTKRARLRVGPLTFDVPYADNAFRNYLLIRNHGYLAWRYRGVVAWVRHTIKYLLFHRGPLGSLTPSQVLRYAFEGLRGDLRGHVDYRA